MWASPESKNSATRLRLKNSTSTEDGNVLRQSYSANFAVFRRFAPNPHKLTGIVNGFSWQVVSEMHQGHFGMVLHDSNSFRSGREMEPTYDIFKRRVGGYPFWIVAVDSLEEARERTNQYALVAPGEYFIYSQGEGIILECVTPVQKYLRVRRRPIWLVPQSWNSLLHGTAT
jgi:hypothetical protein